MTIQEIVSLVQGKILSGRLHRKKALNIALRLIL